MKKAAGRFPIIRSPTWLLGQKGFGAAPLLRQNRHMTPQGKAALELWLLQRDDLLAGRTPRTPGDGLTVRDLCNRFLSVKEAAVSTREITQRHFEDLYICMRFR